MRRHALLAAGFSVLVPFAASDAQTASVDPAARGVDVFLHAPGGASPGAPVPIQIEAFGFPTALTLVPLGSAALTAAWDPESLGPGVSQAPPPVRATSDAAGRAHLDVPMPDGDERMLTLLVGVRSGSHERTRKIQVLRGPLYGVAVHVADPQVVPGGEVSAWVVVMSAATGEPAAGAKVELALVEGEMPRTTVTLAADAAGTAMARVPIPPADEPTWSWQLRARALGPDGSAAGSGEVRLTPREETPGTPHLGAAFAASEVLAGDRAAFTLRLRDATDQPIAGAAVRWWVGPRGTDPPGDTATWDRVSKAATTGADGEVEGAVDAPAIVVADVGTTLRLVARASVEGHALEQSATLSVGLPASAAWLMPEAGTIVPGAAQRMLLSVRDGHGRPVAATFSVEADGLAATVTTGADGDAELRWTPPLDVGALRNVGPCAGGVAAAVIVKPVGDVPALRPRRDPFSICVPVSRELGAVVAFDRPMARMGERVHVRVLEPAKIAGPWSAGPWSAGPWSAGVSPARIAGVPPARTAWSLLLKAPGGARATSVWVEDGDQGADLLLPTGAPGTWTVEAFAPGASRKARVAEGAILVTPTVLPVLAARLAGGRAAPGGAVDVDADLSDGHGRGMPGTVAAFVMDLHGGGSSDAIERIDTRRSLCDALGVEAARCDRFVEGDASLDGLRRGLSGTRVERPAEALEDPGGRARQELYATFGEVLRSLEGAVFEASGAPDRLGDVRRRGARGGWTFNPELMTLVTAAMDPPPRTPGGELLSLADLVTIDPQVTFDSVARRVTRLKLLRLLVAVRGYRHDHQLDADEPLLTDPNALLRKLVRDGTIGEDLLLDPWGGTIQFVPARGPALPFLSVVKGFELHAPGPDGRPGTADDVQGPFERVLESGTPYAKAVGEDRIVDARVDMEVGDTTVTAWQALLEELTGTALGRREGTIGHGSGTGSGQGFGSGHGRLGGTHRTSAGVSTGGGWWAPPMRTDGQGHLRFHVPLGDAETTWRVVLVGVPDGARQAATHVDVPVALPLSARVDAGARWVEGDVVDAAITVRNRTGRALRAAVTAEASGVASIDAKDASRSVDVPAGGAAVARVPVRASSSGAAGLTVTVRAPDVPEDVVHHTWEVIGAGERTDLTRAEWVEGKADLAVSLGDEDGAAKAMRPVGEPRLVLERGLSRPLAAALEAMDPDRLSGREALADAVEVATRIERWGIAKGGERWPTVARAAEIDLRARGRFKAYGDGGGPLDWAAKMRLLGWDPPGPGGYVSPAECPPPAERDRTLAVLEAEPASQGGAAMACWDAAVSSAMEAIGGDGSAVDLARAYLAIADRPYRESLATTLIDRLRDKVALRPSGAITLPEADAKSRAARAVVYAALLRGVHAGKPSAAPASRLWAWIGVQRDADGGYGSSLATREVVRALLHAGVEDQGIARVTLTSGALRREVDVPADGRVEVPLDAAATEVSVTVKGPGVVARLERPVLRLWSRPPDAPESPLHLDVSWPDGARAGTTGVVRVSVRHRRGRTTAVDVRIPLPPGVSLAEPVAGVRQVQGVLAMRRGVGAGDAPTEIDVPVRFGLAGRVTVPEAQATVTFEEAPRAVAPARPFVIQE